MLNSATLRPFDASSFFTEQVILLTDGEICFYILMVLYWYVWGWSLKNEYQHKSIIIVWFECVCVCMYVKRERCIVAQWKYNHKKNANWDNFNLIFTENCNAYAISFFSFVLFSICSFHLLIYFHNFFYHLFYLDGIVCLWYFFFVTFFINI